MRLPGRRRGSELKLPRPPRRVKGRSAAPNPPRGRALTAPTPAAAAAPPGGDAGRPPDAGRFRFGGGLSLLPHALPEDVSRSLGRTAAATGLTPNMLTVLGLLGTGGAATLAAYGHFWQAGLVMLAAGAFDLLDGAVARATGRATTWGAIFDAVSDRLGEFAIFLGLLAWFSAPAHFDREAVILIGVSIGGAMLVSYSRSKAGEYGVRIREGLGTRLERVVILSIGLFADEVLAVLWILAVLTNLTAAQRLGVTWWALRAQPEAERPEAPDVDPSPLPAIDIEPPDPGRERSLSGC